MTTKAKTPEIIQLEANEVDDLQQRIAARQLTERDYDLFTAIVAAYYFVVNLLTRKKLTIARLKKLVFGSRTEATAAVLGRVAEGAASESASVAARAAGAVGSPRRRRRRALRRSRPGGARATDVAAPRTTPAPRASACRTNPWNRATTVPNAKRAGSPS